MYPPHVETAMTPYSTDPSTDVFGRADVRLPTAAEAAAADRAAREQRGVPERVLMENAGRAAALIVQREYPRGRIVAVAGSGNNGGDAAVMMRVLHAWGRDVALIHAGSAPPDPALLHGADIGSAEGGDPRAERLLGGGDVLVDGLLGTGAAGAPRGGVAEWIGRLNAAAAPVVALDVPSGVDATSGRVHDAVNAALTIAFGWPKLGMLLQPARSCCGRIVAVEIGFPPNAVHDVSAYAITPDWVRSRVRRRSASDHKSRAGRLLLLAGSSGMAGAAAIAAEAALRAGAGLLRIVSDADNRVILQTVVPEATFLDREALEDEDTASMHALLAGPGIGQSAGARAALVHTLALMDGKPTVLDADALNLLAGDDTALHDIARNRPLVITPHVLELSRLTGLAVADILQDVVGAARGAADRFGCTVLLKGQPSVVAEPDGRVGVNTTGSSDVATAGMGDQLAGAIAALLVGGASTADAAAMALFLCGRAADLSARGASLAPRDVSAMFARAVARPGAERTGLGLPFVTFDQPPRW
jgi:ADP-dependent NAD(P)H-hydrate dehydratase / NAD(P)H-hydrate epimerase